MQLRTWSWFGLVTLLTVSLARLSLADAPPTEAQTAGPSAADVQQALDKVVSETRAKLSTVETLRVRKEASDRQVAAVRKAYVSETVTLDQLLEAQRRSVTAQVELAQAASQLVPSDVKRNYLAASGELAAWNTGMGAAHKVWKAVHESKPQGAVASDNAREEAQAREQYFQFKSKAEAAKGAFDAAEKALKAAAPATGDTKS